MKHKTLRILFAAAIVLMSLACSLFTRFTHAEPTPTFNYIFTPSTIPLQIEPESIPDGERGVAYEVEIRVSDNVTPVSNVSISSGALPAGLDLTFVDHVDGAKISGVPEELGTFTFTISVGCFATMVVGQSAEMEYVLVVE